MKNHQTGAHREGVSHATLAAATPTAPRLAVQPASTFLFEEERPLPEPLLFRNHPTKVQWLLWEGIMFGGQFVPTRLVSYQVVDKAISN